MRFVYAFSFAVSTTIGLFSQSIYVATNKAEQNSVMAYKQTPSGSFIANEYFSGGKGTGDLEVPALKKDPTHPLANGDDPLISAYGIIITTDKKHLLVVNAGDATVSLFAVKSDESLKLLNTVTVRDKFPLSIAEHGGKVVVASVGRTNGEGSIEAMRIIKDRLEPIPGGFCDLGARPSTVKFSTDGKYVIVTELVSGKVKAFAFEKTLAKSPSDTIDLPRKPSDRFHAIPVGFDIRHGNQGDIIAISEARFLTPDYKLRTDKNKVPQMPKYSWQTGSLSTVLLDKNGKLRLVSEDVLTGDSIEGGEIANCWVEFSKDGKKLWTANALSSSISLYEISDDARAKLLMQTAYKQNDQMAFFSDLILDDKGKTLYQLVGNKGEVLVFEVGERGDLHLKRTLSGLPRYGAFGLASVDKSHKGEW